ncbi:MAG: CHRD domain-containing protein [Burkholderiaceae bacterium]
MKLRSLLFGCLLAFAVAAPAQASLIVYRTVLNGATETPSIGSPATGSAKVTYGTLLHTLLIELTWVGLIGGPAAAGHIHCCTAPGSNVIVAVPFLGLPAAASGSYINNVDLTALASYNGAFVTAHGGTAASAEADLIAGINAGMAYVNLHDAAFPGGEIRGFLAQVPQPGTIALLFAGLGAIGAMRRRRKA